MTKSEIIINVANRMNLPQENISLIFDLIFENIVDSLKKGENVCILRFGTFITQSIKSHRIKDISSNEIITIPEHKVPKFKASNTLLKKLQ